MAIDTERIYIVFAADPYEGRSYQRLGFARGSEDDVKRYFQGQEMGPFYLEEVLLHDIRPDDVSGTVDSRRWQPTLTIEAKIADLERFMPEPEDD
ncbi:TPA: hypothetical protein HA265_04035 [Candidatus Woesearchaeota archaeon]|nr:hypothetical protein [Candidatus Woesearchaeota archaeon]